MCLAIPGKVIDIRTDADGVRMARATFGGIVKEVCLEFTPEAKVDDYILVHVGFALNTVDEEEAKQTFELLRELGQLDELDIPELSS